MRLGLAAALLLLHASYIVLVVAQDNTTAPVKAELAGQVGGGYVQKPDTAANLQHSTVAGQEYEGPMKGRFFSKHDDPASSGDPVCPDEQSADDVKQVAVAFGTFVWREVAMVYAKQQRALGRISSLSASGVTNTQTPTETAKAQSIPASPAGVDATAAQQKPAEGSAQTAATAGSIPVARIMQETAAPAAGQAATQGNVQTGTAGSTPVKPTSASSPKFLLPTSERTSGKGFSGAQDLNHAPTYEALAVGHHPTDDDMLFALHTINAEAEVFPVLKDGEPLDNVTPAKVSLEFLALATGISIANLEVAGVSAFYDLERCRYVLAWTTKATGPTSSPPPLFIATSNTQNPQGAWRIWALDLRPDMMQGVQFCGEQGPSSFHLSHLQMSYSNNAILIGASPSCSSGDATSQHLATLYVLPKDAVLKPAQTHPTNSTATTIPRVQAAIYFAHRSWYRSVVEEELALVPNQYEPFNSHIAPARPQSKADLDDPPLLVMKITQSHLSVATITNEPLDEDFTVESAPMIRAVVVGKGADFANFAGNTDGRPSMPQPGTNLKLAVAGVGMPDEFGGVTYWASMHKGLLYVATGEYWGAGDIRVPSIYWAILNPSDDICHLHRDDQGMVASADGLSLAYPVIAGKGGRAVLAYSYSGPGTVAQEGSGGLTSVKAYPGVATTTVGQGTDYEHQEIELIKRGEGSLVTGPKYMNQADVLVWGYNSAAAVCGDSLWVAAPTTKSNGNVTNPWYGSWVSLLEL